MERRQLRERGPVRVRHPALPPAMKALRRDAELRSDQRRAKILDKACVGMEIRCHSPFYQRPVDIASPASLIAEKISMRHMDGMGFGTQLKAAIKASPYRNQRRFAIEALKWDDANGPQRLNNYIKLDRVPDRATLRHMASLLNTTPSALLNEGIDEGLKEIVTTLLGLEGIPADRADTLADVVIEAKRLLEVLPNDSPIGTRATLAAHAAWQTQQSPAPGI